MERLNVIKVFKPSSKRADYSIRAVHPSAAIQKLRETLDDEAGFQAEQSFKALQGLGGESMVFRHNNRKIKVELAHA